MTQPQGRPPTPSQVKQSPMIEIYGTRYPSINFKQSGITPYLNTIRQAISSFNPFASQQIPSSSRSATGARYGSTWYSPDSYPSGIYFDQSWPSHYDPLQHPRQEKIYEVAPALSQSATMGLTAPTLPRFCARQFSLYRRCLVANGQQKSKCAQEQENILNGRKQMKLQLLKIQGLNNKKYHEVMQVGEYNKGRSVANIPQKEWKDGTGQYLRPDTMWADERYTDINQQEIDQAKARIKARELANKQQMNPIHIQHYDRKYANPPSKIPLYP